MHMQIPPSNDTGTTIGCEGCEKLGPDSKAVTSVMASESENFFALDMNIS